MLHLQFIYAFYIRYFVNVKGYVTSKKTKNKIIDTLLNVIHRNENITLMFEMIALSTSVLFILIGINFCFYLMF